MTTGLDLLREPFPAHLISKLPKPVKRDSPKGRCQECGGWHGLPAVHLDYVGHAALTDRLLDADPNWNWEPFGAKDGLPVMDNFGGMWIKLTVCGVTRMGYGHAGDKEGGDAIKEVIGDALRNAAMRFGAALDLWHKGDLHPEEPKDKGPVHKPTANAIVAPDRKATLIKVLNATLDHYAADDVVGAMEEFDGLTDDEERTFVWDKLPSKIRSAITAQRQA